MLDLDKLSHMSENGQLEAKLAKGGLPESLWETYSSFANTEGGIILLGVKERNDKTLEIVGVPDPDQLVSKFWNAVNNPSKVSANILVNNDVHAENHNGKNVVSISVPRADRRSKPVYIGKDAAHGTYRRNGEGDYRCCEEEIMGMIRDASPVPLDATILEEFNLDALCPETLARYKNDLATVRPNHPWTRLATDEFLVKLGAAGKIPRSTSIHPTRAGLLLFGYENEIVREFPEFFLDYREMAPNRRWNDRIVSNDGEWSGNVFDFWTQAATRLCAGVKRPFSLDTSLRRIDDTSMHAAIREALANALVHADYCGRRGVVALRYADRIEVSNPGSSRIPLDVMMSGGISDARNPTMMKILGLVNVCEKAGSGFDVMKSAAISANAQTPIIEEFFNPDRISLTLFFGEAEAESFRSLHTTNETSRSANVEHFAKNSLGTQPIDSRKAAVIAMAEKSGSFVRSDVERLLGVKTTTAKGVVAELLSDGTIASEGTGRSTRYVLAR